MDFWNFCSTHDKANSLSVKRPLVYGGTLLYVPLCQSLTRNYEMDPKLGKLRIENNRCRKEQAE